MAYSCSCQPYSKIFSRYYRSLLLKLYHIIFIVLQLQIMKVTGLFSIPIFPYKYFLPQHFLNHGTGTHTTLYKFLQLTPTGPTKFNLSIIPWEKACDATRDFSRDNESPCWGGKLLFIKFSYSHNIFILNTWPCSTHNNYINDTI